MDMHYFRNLSACCVSLKWCFRDPLWAILMRYEEYPCINTGMSMQQFHMLTTWVSHEYSYFESWDFMRPYREILTSEKPEAVEERSRRSCKWGWNTRTLTWTKGQIETSACRREITAWRMDMLAHRHAFPLDSQQAYLPILGDGFLRL